MIRILNVSRRTAIAALVLSAFTVSADQAPKKAPVAAVAPASGAKRIPCDLIVVAGAVLTVDSNFKILNESGIAVIGGIIAAISSPADIDARYEAKERIERKSSVIMPGLVNTHTHAAMDLMRGIADDLPLKDWLEKKIFPAEAKNVSPDFVRAGTNLAAL